MKNLGLLDRLIRVIVAEIFFLIGFFWAPYDWQIPLYLITIVMLIQAASGNCGLYKLLGWNSCEIVKRKDNRIIPVFLATIVIIAAVGGYASIVLTRDNFMQDLEKVNQPLNMTIKYAGENDSLKAGQEYGLLANATSAFQAKYTDYRPFAVKFDSGFVDQLSNITRAINSSGKDILGGNLAGGKAELERARAEMEMMMKG